MGSGRNHMARPRWLITLAAFVFAWLIYSWRGRRSIKKQEDDEDDEEDVNPAVETAFNAACKYASSRINNANQNVQLQIYGLYKCAKFGSCKDESGPSALDMEARFKWKAWRDASEQAQTRQ